MWKNASIYTAIVGGACGISLRQIEEGKGELTLFFDGAASEATRFQFEEYVVAHLQRRAIPDSVTRRRMFFCPQCGEAITDSQAQRRRKLGHDSIRCNVCEDVTISLMDREERLAMPVPSQVATMDKAADERRELDSAAITLKGKIESGDFDVFLAHNSKDKPSIVALSEELKKRGLNPWLDVDQIPPGRWFQDVMQAAIPKAKSAAIIIGPHGIGRWELVELRAFISQCVEKGTPVIPVLLPGVKELPAELLFLKEFHRVKFDKAVDEQDSLDALEWGITGERPMRKLV